MGSAAEGEWVWMPTVMGSEAFGIGQTAKNLLKLAACFSKVDSEDLLSDAMVAVCDPDGGRPWDPERGSFLAHMRIVIRDLARRERRSARARRESVDSVWTRPWRVRDPLPTRPSPTRGGSNAVASWAVSCASASCTMPG